MRVETVPIILGILVAIVGLAILADAWLPESMTFGSERRRRSRTERSLGGEACIGLAALCEAAALIGRDTWPYTTVAMLAGAGLFLLGVILNWRYLVDRVSNRGALRRDETPKPNTQKNRIR